MKTLFWRMIALALVLQPCQALKASWSPPVTIPIEDVGGLSASEFDSAGNYLELYQDISTSNGVITAIRLLPTGEEAPTVALSPLADNSTDQILAVSPSGDYLVAAWLDDTTSQIQASVYTTATETWSSFQNVAPVISLNELVVSIDSSNRATLGWIDNNLGVFTIYSSTLSPLTGTWSTPASFLVASMTYINANEFVIDASGHFVAASWRYDNGLNNNYHVIQIDQSAGIPVWTTIDDVNLGMPSPDGFRLSEDSLGNIVGVWQTGSDVNAWNSSSLGGFDTLASGISTSRLYIETDDVGRALLVFFTPNSMNPSPVAQTQTRTLFFSSGNWSPLAILNTPYASDATDVITFSVDSIGPGHGNFTWVQYNASLPPTSGIVQFATLTNPANAMTQGSWSTPVAISNASDIAGSSSITENAAGDLLITWAGTQDFINFNLQVSKKLANSTWSAPVIVFENVGGEQFFSALSNIGKGGLSAELQSVLALSVEIDTPPPPAPPTNLNGVVQKNVFLTQTDRIHLLSWSPSSDTTVVAYQISRNGVVIATIPATGPFVYADHNRSKKIADTYTVTAISAGGGVSAPISIVLK